MPDYIADQEMQTLYMALVLGCFSQVFDECFGQTFNVTRTYPVGIDGANPLILAVHDAKNITLFCEVFLIGEPSMPIRTQWTFISGSSTILTFDSNGVSNSPDSELFMSSPNIDFRRNLTILTFNSSLDNKQIGCGAIGNILSRFDLNIKRLPVLFQQSVADIVAEGDMFIFNIEANSGLPVVPSSFQWYFSGEVLQDSSLINITSYPNITINSVHRNNSGNYSLSVSNEAGTVTGFFILDVQYGPEGIAFKGLIVVANGDNITITGFTSTEGNPEPSSLWYFAGTKVSGNRFNTIMLGQLTISGVMLSDSGNYTNTLMNNVTGNSMTIENVVELFVADPPSLPRNVSVLQVGAEHIDISWNNPTNIGTPKFEQFRIEAVSLFDVVNMTVNATNNYRIQGLKPNTQYSVTIRALSRVEQLGVLVSEPSESVFFNTSIGAPRILKVLLSSTNGSLSLSWELLHTGGEPLEMIQVQCNEDGNNGNAITNTLGVIMECSANVECVIGSVSIGPVKAGMNYSCLLIAKNSVERDEIRTKYINTFTGIPSEPIILDISGGSGSATITLRVDNFGVFVARDFTFMVSVFSTSDTTNPVAVRMITPDSILSPIVAIVVEGLSEGTYLFTVSSHNIFSPSLYTTFSSGVFVQQRPSIIYTRSRITIAPSSLSSTSAIQTTITTTNSCGLSGGVIGGIVIASLLLLVVTGLLIIVLLFFIYKTKGSSEVKLSSNRDLTALKLTDVDYPIVDRVYDQPESQKTIKVEQNIAYGEVHPEK